jgi:hypothetical protein
MPKRCDAMRCQLKVSRLAHAGVNASATRVLVYGRPATSSYVPCRVLTCSHLNVGHSSVKLHEKQRLELERYRLLLPHCFDSIVIFWQAYEPSMLV